CTEPSSSGIGSAPRGMFTRCGKFPRVTHHVGNPSICPVKCLCRFAPRRHERLCKIDQRPMQFRKVTYFHRPVVHLHVNVQVIVSIPWCLQRICPETLQVERKRLFVCTTDHQITTILEVQGSERSVIICLKVVKPSVGREVVVLFSQIELYPVEFLLVLCAMITFQCLVVYSACFFKQLACFHLVILY